MIVKFSEWIEKKFGYTETGAGAAGVYDPKIHIDGTWQGAAGGGQLSSVGDVKISKKKKHKKKKKKT